MISSLAATVATTSATAILATHMVAADMTSGFLWTDIGPKQALVCELHQLEACAAQLPPSARNQLPTRLNDLEYLLGQRGAMVLPLRHADIAGLVITDFRSLPNQQTINWGVGHFALPLKQQALLTYWHELGHLYAIDALSRPGQTITSPYQHEWLADLYLVWRIARETQSFELAWQQYHRRNLAVMADSEFMSHWSVPVLAQVLERYSVEQLQQFSHFHQFWADVSPKLQLHDTDTLNEFSSLIQRTFGAGTVQPLPSYMYWRKPKLGEYLKPTLVEVMGQSEATDWLSSQQMTAE
ncbi:conserved hypothetical protein [Shewanella halifaxensis HAW-EB4]|uniref:Uncharacterized protein n=1 Tax=Shewanella halifaxensis (strain HAW-EB4) TaxID=458817 RepID=B0TTF1_SHEHH|nr:hypothetical protein [Shewanella halifaxensis]ABZ78092.1 conserved hypothetical protein [Shewanella halifaxensis HAW-EB4]